MSDREWILERLRSADRAPAIAVTLPVCDFAADWEAFRTNFEALGGHWLSWVADVAWPARAVADDDVADRLPPTVERIADPWSAEIGVTRVDMAIAETGSLLIGNRPERRRLNSLVPPIHLAICRRTDLVGSLSQALASIPDRSSVLISGSSRTADIEGVLVRGVHGPRELWLVVEDE